VPRRASIIMLLGVCGFFDATAFSKEPIGHPTLTKRSHLEFIRRAQIWTRTNIPKMNLRLGPQGPGSFQPNQAVTCDYVEQPMGGATRKFHCVIRADDVVKVRYGVHNGHVQGTVLATRLLWALGFGADRVYPVRVTCRGCSADPWSHRGPVNAAHQFDPAVIERKPLGHEMWEGHQEAGWVWPELDLIDQSLDGAPPEQRDALKLMAVLMQHTDNGRQQQHLLCMPSGLLNDGVCDKPFLFIHDVGLTFGRANEFNRDEPGSVNFEEWSTTPVWRDPHSCVGHLSKSFTGSIGDPHISEAGRKFLADLLLQLTDLQLRDLFEVAGVERRTTSSGVSKAKVEDWVAAFDRKRGEIASTRCPG
jgi:hypothetical protein